MKGAKELAEMLKRAADRYAEVCGLSLSQETARTIADHLDAKAAIDSAVPGEVGEIQQRADEAHLWDGCPPARCDEAEKDRATLLAIVQRQAGEMADLMRRPAESRALRAEIERDAARAEVERLKDRAAKDDAGVTIHACPPKGAGIMPCCGRTPFEVMADRMTTRPEFVNCDRVRLQTERAALAQENARLINEVGELHAKLAAPSVDMTPGMQPRAMRESAGCHAGTDGDCYWSECPQIMDGEPHKSGRSCPLCNSADDS
jgi:hypothetical protein